MPYKAQYPFRAMRGFSLIELIAVMLLLAILAAVVAPRLVGKRVFDEMGFFESTVAVLRYAQKSAISSRRTVCVNFTSTSVTLYVASVAGSATCDLPLGGPLGRTGPYTITASDSGSIYAPVLPNFTYNSLGVPGQGQSISIAGIPRAIIIEQGSGYVHTVP